MKEVLTRHLLAFVLVAVLTWYTAVGPVHVSSTAGGYGGSSTDPEEHDDRPQEPAPASLDGAFAARPPSLTAETPATVDELDWPEIIGD